MNRFATAVAAVSFALTAGLAQAQMSQGDPERAKAREGARESFKAAHEACKDKPDRRACMTEQICSKASDPKKCFEHAKARGEHHAKRTDDRQKMHEACTGKRGEELGKCLHEQREKSGGGWGHHRRG